MIKTNAMGFISLSTNDYGSQRGSLTIQRWKVCGMLHEGYNGQDESKRRRWSELGGNPTQRESMNHSFRASKNTEHVELHGSSVCACGDLAGIGTRNKVEGICRTGNAI